MKAVIIILNLIIFFTSPFELSTQNDEKNQVEALKRNILTQKIDTNTVKQLIELSLTYLNETPDSSVKYANNALELAEQLRWSSGLEKAESNLGKIFRQIGELEESESHYKTALKLSKELKINSAISSNLASLGSLYLNMGEFNKARKIFEEAVKFNEKTGDNRALAKAFNGLAIIYGNQGEYKKSANSLQSALILNTKLNDSVSTAANLGNMGIIYDDQGDYEKALKYYHLALEMNEKLGNDKGIAANLGNIGVIYENQDDYDKALNYYERAKNIYTEIGFSPGLATMLINIGLVKKSNENFKGALDNYEKALAIYDSLENQQGIALSLINIAEIYLKFNRDEEALQNLNRAIEINKAIGDKRQAAYNLIALSEAHQKLALKDKLSKNTSTKTLKDHYNKSVNYALEALELAKVINLREELHTIYQMVSKNFEKLGDYENALKYHKKFTEEKEYIQSAESKRIIAELEQKRENELKDKELALKNLQLLKKDRELFALFGGIAALILILTVIIYQRRRSEKLLLNILPKKIAKRLKSNEKNIADRFDEVSIVFIDTVGFTNYSKDKQPEAVVSMLNDIFTKFDSLSRKHGLEKIKTIGDSYMAVAGLPEPDEDNTIKAAEFAIEAKKLMHNYKTSEGTELFFRIGIDSGPVVAGVIGENKFIYDLWGDAVNTASRMEVYGIPDKIQVTERFAKKLMKRKPEFTSRLEERGKIKVKGKGDVKTYFLIEAN